MNQPPSERLATLDTIRGIAVMGILAMNIAAFALPGSAYFNPRAWGGAEGADLAAWLVNFLFFDGKMRGLFSFLFGASMLLVIDRAEAKGENPTRIHFSRMFWLLIFGLAHLWLVWWGDILSHYALIGAIAFAFRKLDAGQLVVRGLILVVIQCLAMAMFIGFLAIAYATAGSPNPEAARAAAEALAGFNREFGVPPAPDLAKEIALYRSDYAAILADRFKHNLWSPLTGLGLVGWETLGYMLLGMAALKSGLLAGGWERQRLLKWLAIGFGIGLPAYAALAGAMLAQDFSLAAVMAFGFALPTPFRPLMIMGWLCLILLAMRPGGWLTGHVAAAGRMAFTNYLMTSLICTTLFYGYGLGWFGQLSRAQLVPVVLAVWAAMLFWSKPWLTLFRYGPLEWLWRSLARGRLQPMWRGLPTPAR